MSISTLLAQKNEVTVYDIDPIRIEKINNNKSTIEDVDISNFLKTKKLAIYATLNNEEAFKNADFIIVATPTNYDEDLNEFNTDSVDSVVMRALELNKSALIIIKSTIPVGHTKKLQKKYSTDRIIFSPEFLREGRALHDNLYPERIIIGSSSEQSKDFSVLLNEAAIKKDIDIIFMPSTEAEAVKLFANTYLAMRVAFFNELDTYSLCNNLQTESIINGICLDSRIGDSYNNPSFGYGGYCLPKDTKQLLANFNEIPQNIIRAIVESNSTRKYFIFEEILKKKPNLIGFYRLNMKEGSDNFRSSASLEILKLLKNQNIRIMIYEPTLNNKTFLDCKLENNLSLFKKSCDLIIANRNSDDLVDIPEKVFTRDIFQKD